jgi:hypothetical protein
VIRPVPFSSFRHLQQLRIGDFWQPSAAAHLQNIFDYRLHFVGDRRIQYVFDFFWCHFGTFRLAESSSTAKQTTNVFCRP